MADLASMYQWFSDSYGNQLNQTQHAQQQANQNMMGVAQGITNRIFSERDRVDAMKERELQRAMQERDYLTRRSDVEWSQNHQMRQEKLAVEQAEREAKKLEDLLATSGQKRKREEEMRPFELDMIKAQSAKANADASKSANWKADQDEDRKLKERQIGIAEMTGKANAAQSYSAAALHNEQTRQLRENPKPNSLDVASMRIDAKTRGELFKALEKRKEDDQSATIDDVIGDYPGLAEPKYRRRNGDLVFKFPDGSLKVKDQGHWVNAPVGDSGGGQPAPSAAAPPQPYRNEEPDPNKFLHRIVRNPGYPGA